MKICMINTLFTTLAFGVLFVSPSARFNRLGFSITLMLTLTAADIVQSSYLPISDTMLWITFYIMCSWSFSFLTTLESFIVIILYNMPNQHRDRRLGSWGRMFEGVVVGLQKQQHTVRRMRSWLLYLWGCRCLPAKMYLRSRISCLKASEHALPSSSVNVKSIYVVPAEHIRQIDKASSSPADRHTERASERNSERDALSERHRSLDVQSSSRQDLTRPTARLSGAFDEAASGGAKPLATPTHPASARPSVVAFDATVLKSVLSMDIDGVDAAYVRKAFHLLDDQQRGYIENARMQAFLQHFGNCIDLAEIAAEHVGHWDIKEFTRLCVGLIEELGSEWFEKILSSVEVSRLAQEEQLQLLWHSRAVTVDRYARRILPLAYYTCCILLCCIRLPDPVPQPVLTAG